MSQNVHHPNHYIAGKYECREIEKALSDKTVQENVTLTPQASRLWFAAYEYLWRWPFKNGVEDLEKCRDNIDQLILEMKAQENLEETIRRYPKVTWGHDEDGNITREIQWVNEGQVGIAMMSPTDDLDWDEKPREY